MIYFVKQENVGDLIHIVYASFSEKELTEKELKKLLRDIRIKNKKQNVTGLLLYNDGAFIQVIEGESDIIHNLYNIIKVDPRHSNIVKLLDEPIEERAFPDWSMGFRKINRKQSAGIKGFSDFLVIDDPEKTLKGSKKEVMQLLNSFRKHA